jgi:hypothetical protein
MEFAVVWIWSGSWLLAYDWEVAETLGIGT